MLVREYGEGTFEQWRGTVVFAADDGVTTPKVELRDDSLPENDAGDDE